MLIGVDRDRMVLMVVDGLHWVMVWKFMWEDLLWALQVKACVGKMEVVEPTMRLPAGPPPPGPSRQGPPPDVPPGGPLPCCDLPGLTNPGDQARKVTINHMMMVKMFF